MGCDQLYTINVHERTKWNLSPKLPSFASLTRTFLLFVIISLASSQSTVEVGITAPTELPSQEVTTDKIPHSTTSNEDASSNENEPFQTYCVDERCTVQFNASKAAVDRMLTYTKEIFKQYANGGEITEEGLKKFLTQIGVLRSSEDSHEGHDHGSHDDYADHEGHDHEDVSLGDIFGFDYYYEVDDVEISDKCLESARALLNEFNKGKDVDSFSLTDFWLLLPRLVFNLNSEFCRPIADDFEEEVEEPVKESRLKVWLISITSVAVISLLSIIGILIVPLMRHSVHFNRLLSFLIALAVGTLIGDGLLHLLPHAMGGGDHSGHAHTPDVVAEERNKVMKSLVAVLGIYMFFVFESAMGMWKKRKQQKSSPEKKPIGSPSDLTVVSPVKSSDALFPNCPELKETLLTSSKDETTFTLASTPVDDADIHGSQDSGCSSASGCNHNHAAEAANWDCGNKTPPFPVKLNLPGDEERIGEKLNEKLEVPAITIEGPHHGHHHGHSHHSPELAKASGIKDMAWMILMGDGLHNFSDGLAIGAAFSSSIAAGLSTSLAVFCHELPHELGDFAVLLNAGMSIKQALLYNGLCACLAFIGVIIGLAIGEYTTTVKLWILAITAGGFLYVALVDMLPQMLESSLQKDGLFRFIYQNVGFLLGVVIMLLIALYEGAFHEVFSGSTGGGHDHHGHGH